LGHKSGKPPQDEIDFRERIPYNAMNFFTHLLGRRESGCGSYSDKVAIWLHDIESNILR
jgi:hypothetical protein